jgi:spermidine synthase
LSYLYPVTLRRRVGEAGIKLELYLYCNQLQLGNDDILYSDGKRYRPAVVAVNYLKPFLPGVKSVLVLGTGLGSMVRVMSSKGFTPKFTLVESDKEILKWAVELLAYDCPSEVAPVCGDAKAFMAKNEAKYGLVFIDIFIGRLVPDFVTTAEFLKQCRDSLAPGGRLAFNYIINDKRQWESVQEVFSAIFPNHKIVDHQINRIFITG